MNAMDIVAIAIGIANVRPLVGADCRDRPHMTLAIASMGASDALGLAVSVVICIYLLYALLRGEKF